MAKLLPRLSFPFLALLLISLGGSGCGRQAAKAKISAGQRVAEKSSVLAAASPLLATAEPSATTQPSPTASPAQPFLRIEAAMHTAPIRDVSADAASRIALTVSDDKTARLWELPTGRALRVFRPPLGANREGELCSGALSPDGSIAAIGGVTSLPGDAGYAVYLFDTASGRLLRTLATHRGEPLHLRFSGDGRWLAGVLNEGGLRV